MIVAGKNAVWEAILSDLPVEEIYFAKGSHDMRDLVKLAREKGVPTQFVDRSELDVKSEGVRHQGVVAVAKDFGYCTLDELIALNSADGAAPFLLVLDGIMDPHNLGSIIRVAECAGADGVIIPSRRSASVNATVMRVSAGAAAHVKVARVVNINDAVRRLKDEFFNVYCADMDGESMYGVDLRSATALVIGGEGDGVSRLTAKLCDRAVSIPQFGKVNSLNASVACGIICYEAVRQRGGKL